MGLLGILLIVGGAVIFIAVIITIVAVVSKKMKKVKPAVTVQPTPSPAVPETPEQTEYVMVRNVIYRVGEDDILEQGTYKIYNINIPEKDMDIRYLGRLSTQKSGTTLTLNKGDTICCENYTALLTKVVAQQ